MCMLLDDRTSAAKNSEPVNAASPAFPFGSTANGGPSPQFWSELEQLDNYYDISQAALWTFMSFKGRPSYNPDLLMDFHGWQRNIRELKANSGDALKYVVLGSRRPGIFCFGGDLDYFMKCIATRNRNALYHYGRSCIEILHNNWRALDSELITIGLAQGDALGGGFESLLSFDVICAEKGAKFGFPEHMFGLFPGMGALSILGNKVGSAKAEQIIRTPKMLQAEELYEMGLVHILAEPGEGIAEVRRYIAKNSKRHAAHYRYQMAARRASPLAFDELDDIVALWADACVRLDDHYLQVMRRLVSAQTKLAKDDPEPSNVVELATAAD